MKNFRFNILYRQLCNEEISGTDYLDNLSLLKDCLNEDLLEAIEDRKQFQDWETLCVLIWGIQRFPNEGFISPLCDLLENRYNDDLLEAVVDAFFEIGDQKAIPSLVKALTYEIPGDDDFNFNKKCLDAILKCGTKKDIAELRRTLNIISHKKLLMDQIKEFAEIVLTKLKSKENLAH